MPFITLLTDFGSKNGFTGVLKGVIWKIAPDTQIADITHEITAQNIMEGAIALWRAAPFFPAGTIHVAVVDPGVGTARRPIAAQVGDHYFVGPDNGIFTPLMEEAESKQQGVKVFHLDNPKYWLPKVSNTFHGRDIFAPVAGHLAAGVPIGKIGTLINDPVRLVMPHPVRTERGWQGQVVLIDIFGNIATNLSGDLVRNKPNVMIQIGGERIQGLVKSYGERPPGEVVALVDSENFLEVAVVNGNGAQKAGAAIGDPVELVYL
jgi:S-adenosyl-L-methionine hydrolase (adenosine-forming)